MHWIDTRNFVFRFRPQYWSLHVRLVIAGLFVQVLVAVVMVVTEIKTIEKSAGLEFGQRVEHIAPLLNAALIEPLIQRDYATLFNVLAETQHPENYKYLILFDSRDKVVASVGNAVALPYPPVDIDLMHLPWDRPDGCIHLMLPIVHSGVTLGALRYGVSIEPSRSLRTALVTSTLVIAISGLILGTSAFALLGLGLTRGLRSLVDSSKKVAQGDYVLIAASKGSGELAQVAVAFNDMANAVRDRVAALQASQEQQEVYIRQIRDEKSRLAALLQAMRFGVLLLDRHGKALYANQTFATLWGFELSSLEAEFRLGIDPEISSLRHCTHPALIRLLYEDLRTSERSGHFDIRLENGLDIQVSGAPVADTDTQTIGQLWIFEDVTAENQTRRLVNRLAERDSLTGLLNRHTFNIFLESAATDLARSFALLFIDLDDFKLINDLNGHAFGDRLLKSVASALTLTFGASATVSRLGGDEFAVVVHDVDPDRVGSVCKRLLRNVSSAAGTVMAYAGNPVRISCSVGVAWFPQDATKAEPLLAAADQAMYAAKSAGRNTFRQYVPQSDASSQKNQWLVWSGRLNEAFEQDLFQVFLQGIYHQTTGAVEHFEALVRLEDAENPGRYHSVAELILHAEESGKVQVLDRLMLARCIDYLGQHPGHPPIAVNLSSRTVVDISVVTYVTNLLMRAAVSPARLHLELTETAALSNLDLAVITVKGLQQLGCLVGLDDFGSGFTSFAHLRELKVDYIKVDGAFIRSLAHSLESQILLRAVVDIAHASGRKVIAEWIEDESILNMVRAYDVDLLQGYLLCKPFRAF